MSLLFFGFPDEGLVGAPADDDLPAWFAFTQVWQLPWLTDNGTIDGPDMQEMLWNVRSPVYDIIGGGGFKASWIRRAQILGGGI